MPRRSGRSGKGVGEGVPMMMWARVRGRGREGSKFLVVIAGGTGIYAEMLGCSVLALCAKDLGFVPTAALCKKKGSCIEDY